VYVLVTSFGSGGPPKLTYTIVPIATKNITPTTTTACAFDEDILQTTQPTTCRTLQPLHQASSTRIHNCVMNDFWWEVMAIVIITISATNSSFHRISWRYSTYFSCIILMASSFLTWNNKCIYIVLKLPKAQQGIYFASWQTRPVFLHTESISCSKHIRCSNESNNALASILFNLGSPPSQSFGRCSNRVKWDQDRGYPIYVIW